MTPRFGVLAAIAIAAMSLVFAAAPEAHKTVVSKFTYHRDVLPILEAKCARCHVTDGVARPLLNYAEASMFPWALQQELLSKRMPPFAADPGLAPLKGHLPLTTAEFDTIMTWAAGGTPEGSPVARPPAASSSIQWPLGTPDQVVTLPRPIALPGDQSRLDREVVLAAPSTTRRLIRAVDLQPGAPANVRRAEFAIRSNGADTVVALWLPGEAPQLLERNAAFDLPANATIVARLYYARPAAANATVQDRSRVGLYFAKPGAPTVQPIVIHDDLVTAGDPVRTITHAITRAAHLLAVRPISGPADAIVQVTVIDRAGSRTPIMRLTLRHEWPRRYVLATPIALPPGSRVELTTIGSQGALWQSLTGDAIVGPDPAPLRIALEVVP